MGLRIHKLDSFKSKLDSQSIIFVFQSFLVITVLTEKYLWLLTLALCFFNYMLWNNLCVLKYVNHLFKSIVTIIHHKDEIVKRWNMTIKNWFSRPYFPFLSTYLFFYLFISLSIYQHSWISFLLVLWWCGKLL